MEDQDTPVSEELEQEHEVEHQEVVEQRTVPLQALEAERRKRQDLEAQNRVLQEYMLKSKGEVKEPEDEEDEEEFITKAELKRRLEKTTFSQKRELLEEAYCSAKPEAVEQINKHLESIIKRKPWLAQTIESAPNRYARAYEIVQDYAPKEETSTSKFRDHKADAKKIVENSQKPGNPATIAKSAQSSNADYLRSIAGKPEFREYRKKMLAGGNHMEPLNGNRNDNYHFG